MLSAIKTPKTSLRALKKTGALVVLSCLVAASLGSPVTRADTYDDQINSLNAQNAQNQNALGSLEGQAASYQAAISQLQSQISTIQGQIAANQAQQASLAAQIQQDEDEISHEKQVLGEDLKTMYVDGQMSTIEELATSNSLSDYVDKQTYREAVQSKIQSTLKEIANLQAQLQQQKHQVDELLIDENSQNDALNAAEAQQQQLLAYNQSQQDAYTAQMRANNTKIASLRAQQAAAMAARFGGAPGTGPACGGGYPGMWCDAAQDSLVDSWGMYNRECVSYAAWAMTAKYGHHVPYGLGNANQWPAGARADNIPTGSTPRVGSVAIWYVGTYGHAMVVDAVYGDGSFLISQYNYSFNGTYSTMVVGPNSGFTFIYF